MELRGKYRFWASLIGYGLAMAFLLLLLRWLQLRFFLFDHSTEIYTGAVALIFTCLGIWIAHQLTVPSKKYIISETKQGETEAPAASMNIENSGLSKRELEILNMMAKGMSNQEIADTLYISLSTVKSHASSIFGKLDVVRRTQAIEKAKTLKIIH